MANKRKRSYERGNELKDLDAKEEKVEVAEEPQPSYNTIKQSKQKLQLQISARVIQNGPVTGKRYEWERSGAIVEVDEEDAPGLLAKKLGDKPCCGGNPEHMKLFILVE